MELYALRGFQNCSVTDLQNALEMGRGSFYYYFKDQDELFQTCIERYFLEPKQRALGSVRDDVSMEQMIEAMLSYLYSLRDALMTFEVKRINTSNVNNLLFTAYSRYPALHRRAQRLALREVELWRHAIRNGQKAGELRRDIDVDQIALMCTHIKDSYDNALAQTQMDFSLLAKTYSEFHNLLKK